MGSLVRTAMNWYIPLLQHDEFPVSQLPVCTDSLNGTIIYLDTDKVLTRLHCNHVSVHVEIISTAAAETV